MTLGGRPSGATNLFFALLAVAMAVTAQWLLGGSWPWAGGFLYAVAAALVVFTLRRHPGPLPPDPPPSTKERPRPRALRYLGVALLCAGAAAGLWAFYLFSSPAEGIVAWLWCLIAAATLLLGAVILDLRRSRISEEEQCSPQLLGLLLAILLLAALVRTWHLSTLPFGTWYDEAENGLVGLQILAEPSYKPIYEPRVNSAGHYLLLLASSLRLLGTSTQSIRLVSALMGTLTVAAGYLMGREMFGRRWGLVLAFFMAVSRWNINFSRIGMYNVSTPLFELLALGFLLRGLRRRRYLDFALSGLAMGLGTVFYTGFWPFTLVVVIFLAHTAAAERRALRGNWGGLMVLALSALLIVSPVARYGAEHQETFLERTRKASVFRGKNGEQALQAIGRSTVNYLLMFNYRGDRYGRHNLSGEPMLDPLSGALMVLGGSLCLWRWRRPRSLLLPLWLLTMLVPGILSLEWEAPHALRTIGALGPAYLLATCVLRDLGAQWQMAMGHRVDIMCRALVTMGLALVGWSNLHTYFFVQARDYETWRDFSTAETITARTMAELGTSVDYYVISYFHDHPVLRFLAPEVRDYHRIETHEDLPLPRASDRDVVIALGDRSLNLLEQARTYYPNAEFQQYTSPSGGPPVAFIIKLSPEDVLGIRGLVGRYRAGDDWSAEPVLERRDDRLFFQWSGESPLAPPFLAEWGGVLRVPEYGTYRLVLRSPADAELHLDGTLLMEGEGGVSREVILARGNHALHIRAVGGDGSLEFSWQTPGGAEEVVPSWALYSAPVTGKGLLATYYPNGSWENPPAFAQIDGQVGFYYHIAPLPMPYSVQWKGSILIPEDGTYVFAIQSIDESVLYLDGAELAVAAHRDEYAQAPMDLEAGYYNLLLRYAARTDHMYVYLYWTPPGGMREIIPAEVLFPAQDSWELGSAAPGGK